MQMYLTGLCKRVSTLRQRLASMDPEKSMSAEVAVLAGEVAHPLLHEVLDWRIVFLDRPLEVGT